MDPLTLIAAALADPAIRTAVEDILGKVFHEIEYDLLVRRQDPQYAAKQDVIYAAKKAAKTPEEILSAQKALALLMSGAQ